MTTELEGDILEENYNESVELDEFQEDPDDDLTIPEQPKRKSTKHPLPREKKQKTEQKSKEDIMLDEAMSVLAARKSRVADADEIFGQNVTASLRNIVDNRCKEFLKVKIQELIFQAQFGMLLMPFQQTNIVPGPRPQLQSTFHQQHTYPYQRDTIYSNFGAAQSPNCSSNSNENTASYSGTQ